MSKGDPTTQFLTSLSKKDEDSRLTAYDPSTGEMSLHTRIDLQETTFKDYQISADDNQLSVDSDLLRRDAAAPPADVTIRIIFTIFCANSVVFCITMLLGFVPYALLVFDETKQVAIVLSSVTGTLFVVLYFLMAWQRKNKLGVVFWVSWCFTRMFFLGSISALVDNVVPIYTDVIFFACSISVVLYTVVYPRIYSDQLSEQPEEDLVKRTLILMLVSGLVVWCIGIYIFIEEHAWIVALVCLPLFVAFCFYCRWQIQLVFRENRYNLSREDRELAVIQFYVDPLVMLARKIF